MSTCAMRAMAEQQAEICRVFAHPTRILILWTLLEAEKTVSEIAVAVDASLQNTSQHLRIMKQCDVVNSRRDAQMIYYRISDFAATRCQPMLEVARDGATLLKEPS
jgi:ArsR family transcriptional regulator, virulence genes transcriptional regulator